MTNQDAALADWRAASAAADPAPFTARTIATYRCLWLSIIGNVGWYWPVIEQGRLVELHSLALGGHDSLIGYVAGKMERRIVEAQQLQSWNQQKT